MVIGKVWDALNSLKTLGDPKSDGGFSIAALGQQKARDAIKSVLNDLNAQYGVIEQSGFHVNDIAIELTLIPSVSIFIDQTEDASLEKIESTLSQDGLTTFQRSLLTVIKQLYQLNGLANESDHEVAFIEVELSIPPAVTAHLKPNRPGSDGASKSRHLLV